MEHENSFKLPISIVSPSDLKRVKRELDGVSEVMLQMEIRQPGEEQTKLPKMSKHLEDVAEINSLNLLHKDDREKLGEFMSALITAAPVIHMSFSAEPSNKFLNRLMQYLRDSFDPFILVTVGMAPAIGAGCIVRTTNKFFDLSLKQTLANHRQDLVKALNEAADLNQVAAEGAAV